MIQPSSKMPFWSNFRNCMGYAATLMGSGGFHSSGFYPPHWQRDQRAESISLPRKNRILTSARTPVLTLLTSKCASRHNAVHCLNIATSKSGVFLTLLTLKCASHAHLNFEKCSEHEVFLCVVFGILTSKCASCHNGVQFFISHLTRWLRTRRFSEPTFRPSGQTLEKRSVSRLFYLFTHLLSSWFFPPLLFHLSILSEVWLLNVPR